MHQQLVSQTVIRLLANDGNTESLYSWDSHDAHCRMQVTPLNKLPATTQHSTIELSQTLLCAAGNRSGSLRADAARRNGDSEGDGAPVKNRSSPV